MDMPKKKKKDVLLGDELEKNEVASIESEIVNGYRNFELLINNETIYFRVYDPSIEQQSTIADKYTERYTELINEGKFMLWDVLCSRLAEKNIWTKEDEDYNNKATDELKDIIIKYLNIKKDPNFNKTSASELRKKYFDLKDSITEHTTKKMKFFSNSIENKADDFAMKYKLMYCLYYKNGDEYEQWFKNIEDVNNFRNTNTLNRILSQCISFWAGIKQELLSNSPEDDPIFGGDGLHMLLGDLNGEQSTESMKVEEKVS